MHIRNSVEGCDDHSHVGIELGCDRLENKGFSTPGGRDCKDISPRQELFNGHLLLRRKGVPKPLSNVSFYN